MIATPRGNLSFMTMLVLVALLLSGGCAKRVGGPEVKTAGPVTGNIIEHTVQPGEDLAAIADDYYGDPGNAADIALLNGLTGEGRLVPGTVLKLRFDSDQWGGAQRRAQALVPYNEGVEMLATERLGEAQARFEQALDIAPDLLAARYNLALVLLKRGRSEAALQHLDILVAQRPEAEDFAFALGNALFQTSNFPLAATQFNALLIMDPGNKRAAFGYARSLQEAGDRQGALTAWRNYLKLDSSSGWADAARRNLEALQNGD